ncbi:MAG: HyaD/HybD family hydrogenase maturation endopeptidase [Thermodesulfovibrionia bacterium]
MGVRVGVLGIGNILLSDDGIGVHVIRRLKDRYRFPDNVRLIDGGTMGLDLLPFLEDIERLIIIDAVNLNKPYGTVEIITVDRIPTILNSKLSVHQIGISDLFFAMRIKGLPIKEVMLIGIQPGSLEVGTEPSEEIKAGIETVIDHIINKMREWGVEVIGDEG